MDQVKKRYVNRKMSPRVPIYKWSRFQAKTTHNRPDILRVQNAGSREKRP